MRHEVTRIIKAEHSAIKAVLLRLQIDLAVQREKGLLPDFDALRMMLFYIDEFPEKQHHRKESGVLFPKLRARAPEMRHLLDRLDSDHLRGEYNIRDIQHALLAFEMMGESRRLAFETAVSRFCDFYINHMDAEERHVLPVAEAVLSEADWDDMAAAFRVDGDPLAGLKPEQDCQHLLWRVFHAPRHAHLPTLEKT
jgi:hemerythrin-like domain-containing protein